MSPKNTPTSKRAAKTGIWGLDNILSGGFSRGHLFLIEGAPGTGKTTIALQFLLEGVRAGETCLYITLSETEEELRSGAVEIDGWEDVWECFARHGAYRYLELAGRRWLLPGRSPLVGRLRDLLSQATGVPIASTGDWAKTTTPADVRIDSAPKMIPASANPVPR